jgi:peptide/nickel transport system substrate-binding protein
MELRLLGPVEVTIDDRPLPLGATKQRALLALLALRVNETVSSDRLVDGLWGEDPPPTAAKMVQLYVSQLRRMFDGSGLRIETHGRGYELCVPDGTVDVTRFERLVEQAADGAPSGAAREALALWRGAPLADVADEPFAGPEIRRLEELWLEACELAIDADLAAGRNQPALGELGRLLDEHPLRERFHAQRMLALYRAGRQAEALEAYTAARRRLVDDVGLEPGAELRELHERILRQDPALRLPSAATAAPPAAEPEPAPARRTTLRLVVAAAIAALLALGAFAATRLLRSDHYTSIAANAVGAIDPNKAAITKEITNLASDPGAVVGGDGSVWVASAPDGTVSRISDDSPSIKVIEVGPTPKALAFGGGSLWVAGEDDGFIRRVDPANNRVAQKIRVGNGLQAVTVAGGAVWAATAIDGEVVRIDLRSGRRTRLPVGGHPVALTTGLGAVWVAREDAGDVERLDLHSGEPVDSIRVGDGPSALAVGLGAVWAANQQDGTVSRIDPATDQATRVPAGRAPAGLAIADDAVWVADASGAILRLDPRTQAVTDRLRTGTIPAGLATVGKTLWVSAGAPLSAHRGGTLRVGVGGMPLDLDPALGGYYDPATLVAVAYEGLVEFRRAPGVPGTRMVAGLARAVPAPSDGGRRYVFRLRDGLRYADGTRVQASDVRLAIERSLRQPDDVRALLRSVQGMTKCRLRPGRCDLSSGIVADNDAGTVTIRLRTRDPGFLATLALPRFALVSPHAGRPRVARAPIGTGPYRVTSLTRRSAVLTRNPYFEARVPEGRPAGLADRIELEHGSAHAQDAAAEQGRLDVSTGLAPGELARLLPRIGSRVHSGAFAGTHLAWFNEHRPPFDDRRVRLAVNFAVDRGRIAHLNGGSPIATPTCQLLPPGVSGYRPTCSFSAVASPGGVWRAPDLARARRLVAASHTRGTPIAVATWGTNPMVGYIVHVLSSLGFPSRIEMAPPMPDDPQHRPQIGIGGWAAESPEPGRFILGLIGCREQPDFCDRQIDATVMHAQAVGPAANGDWPRIERQIAHAAPLVPLFNDRRIAVTSRRAGNLQFNPIMGLLLDQVWVR